MSNQHLVNLGLAADPKTGKFKPRPVNGRWVQPLRSPLLTGSWVRACAVALDANGRDKKGREHGHGEPLYAIEYADGMYSYFRSSEPIAAVLSRKYPRAVVVIEDVRGLS